MKFSEFVFLSFQNDFFFNDRLLGVTAEEGILFLVILCDIYAS